MRTTSSMPRFHRGLAPSTPCNQSLQRQIAFRLAPSFGNRFVRHNTQADIRDDPSSTGDTISVGSRPLKMMRYEDNVSNTLQTPAPATPVASLQWQIGQATQYTQQPSGLRQVSGIRSSGMIPRQISAAVPAPIYYKDPSPRSPSPTGTDHISTCYSLI
ncbi:hypothetical protein BDV97DRAFT_175412 [Delphinella strobiligena]|nr:hypothetical protein BDV97DRAFT_175412 [Delphinella strobiligena]